MIPFTDEELKEMLRGRMGENRFIHSLNVAEKAEYLAKKYGVDPATAYTTGLVHDITKHTDEAEQLKIIEDSGIILSQVEKSNAKLWHAISGSVFVRDVLRCENPEAVSAVRYHTTGRAGMTTLEKIIYIADYISAERNFPGVDFMRELADEDLDKACLYAVNFAIPDLVRRQVVLHPDSVALYNELKMKNITIESERTDEI